MKEKTLNILSFIQQMEAHQISLVLQDISVLLELMRDHLLIMRINGKLLTSIHAFQDNTVHLVLAQIALPVLTTLCMVELALQTASRRLQDITLTLLDHQTSSLKSVHKVITVPLDQIIPTPTIVPRVLSARQPVQSSPLTVLLAHQDIGVQSNPCFQ